ncbi:hypothetical protein BV898_16455 [Hypsibius exemplaris]|uniref:Nicotinamide riboside kinase 1 n=1 Tax=Hypsibius exemplaris TaxID=2072580 RepID=A0A9X6NM18_HYPEX|nr:hypothetical protein BV898_16455 [Hypsibius exemplaris]
MDVRYYMTLTYEECRRRRIKRNYDPADVPGYFDKVVWPMHVKYAAELERLPGARNIEYLSGSSPSETSFAKIVSDVSDLVGSSVGETTGPCIIAYQWKWSSDSLL